MCVCVCVGGGESVPYRAVWVGVGVGVGVGLWDRGGRIDPLGGQSISQPHSSIDIGCREKGASGRSRSNNDFRSVTPSLT